MQLIHGGTKDPNLAGLIPELQLLSTVPQLPLHHYPTYYRHGCYYTGSEDHHYLSYARSVISIILIYSDK